MRSFAILFASAALVTTAAQATLFDDIGKSFDQGGLPKSAALRGYWAGRCVTANEQDKVQPAVFVYKIIKDEKEFPPQRPSFTYYYEKADKADRFDKFTPKQVEAYPAIKQWFAQESWSKVEAIDGSLVNYYRPSDGVRFERAVRVFEDEFTRTILVRIRRESTKLADVSTFCYFTKSLGTLEGGTTTDTPAFSFGTTGEVGNQTVSAKNPTPDVELKTVEIRNLGSRLIRIRGYQLVMADGTVAKGGSITRLYGGGTLIIYMENKKPFKLQRLDFYVGGSTQNIEVVGRT